MSCFKDTLKFVLREDFCSYPSLTPCDLYLSENILFIKNIHKAEVEDIKIADIVGCQSVIKKAKKWEKSADVSCYLRIYYYPLKTSTGILNKQLRREKQAVKFLMNKFNVYEDNAAIVNRWRSAILWLLRGKKLIMNGAEVEIPRSLPMPLKLLFIVNPFSGSGKASGIFKAQVLPVLQESDLHYDLLITDKANCARNYVKASDLAKWNGIVVVSGDGLLFEVYNGLMERSDWETAIKIPLGVIPGGSGNGLARAISYATGEPFDTAVVIPSILNVLHGRSSPMDLVCVQTAEDTIYSFLGIGWGLMSDIDIESEKLRAIGEARFTLWAVIRALSLRTYKGRLSYLPVNNYSFNNVKTFIGPRMKRSKTVDSKTSGSKAMEVSNGLSNVEPIFRSKSFGSEKSEIPSYDKNVELVKFSYSGEFSPLKREDIDLQPTVIGHDHDNTTSLATVKSKGHSSCLPSLSDPVPKDWTVVEGDFVLVYAGNQTHISSDVFFAPDAKLDDGIIWLIVIRSGVSRAKVIYFLSSLHNGDHVNIPYVDMIPVYAFRLEPFQSEGILTVDGEVVPCGTIQAEVLPSVARIMTR